ncbi:MAG TPA: hypothetical protein VGE98_09925 [Thermoanaerobaculia bacterium]
MRRRAASIACLLCVPLVMSSCATGAMAPGGEPERRVDRVDIVSDWDGLGRPQHGERTVDGRSPADAARLAALLRALEAPPLPEADLQNLGITKAWLVDNVSSALEQRFDHGNIASALKEADGRWSHARLTTEERERFATAFTDLDLVGPHLKDGIGIGIVYTDDYPTLAATLTLRGGETIRVSSKRQQGLFMLPWEVERAGVAFFTYNADINRALVALMPKGFANRDRIAGRWLRSEIATWVVSAKALTWGAEAARRRFGPALGERYEILESRFGSENTIDLAAGDRNLWVARLRDRSLPAQFDIAAAIPFRADGLVGLDAFRKGIDRNVTLVLSQPWLTENARGRITLHWARDRSLSPEAAAKLLADLRSGGKTELARQLAPLLQRAAFLEVELSCCSGISRWIVLADGRTVLWHFGSGGGAGSLAQALAGMGSWTCNGWTCVGAVFDHGKSPDFAPKTDR